MTKHAEVNVQRRYVTVSTNTGFPTTNPINVLVTEQEHGRISDRLGLSMSIENAETIRNGLNLAIDKARADLADAEHKQTVADLKAVINGVYLNNAGKVQRVREIIRNWDLQGAL